MRGRRAPQESDTEVVKQPEEHNKDEPLSSSVNNSKGDISSDQFVTPSKEDSISETPSSGRGARRSASVRRSASSSRSTSVTPSSRSRSKARNMSDKLEKETANPEKPAESKDSTTQDKKADSKDPKPQDKKADSKDPKPQDKIAAGSKDVVGTPDKPSRSVKESPAATSTPNRQPTFAVNKHHSEAKASKVVQVMKNRLLKVLMGLN